eukprot:477365-Amphidinium_carterae.1
MQNVLIAKTWDAEGMVKYQPKIADYGLAERRSAWAMDAMDCTCAYMAPETRHGRFSEKSD